MPLIQLIDIYKTYEKKGLAVHALRNLNLTINEGEFVTIWGPSGSGKSTLLNIMGTLDYPTNGKYLFNGKAVLRYRDEQLSLFRSQNIGFVFQSFNLLQHLTALENVMMPAGYLRKLDKKAARKRALELLEQVGLADRVNHLPGELSGGEEQRVAIARALMNDPQIILADEPTGNLDSKSHKMIMEILQDLHKKGRTIVVVSHNPEFVDIAERAIELRDGQVVNTAKEAVSLP